MRACKTLTFLCIIILLSACGDSGDNSEVTGPALAPVDETTLATLQGKAAKYDKLEALFNGGENGFVADEEGSVLLTEHAKPLFDSFPDEMSRNGFTINGDQISIPNVTARKITTSVVFNSPKLWSWMKRVADTARYPQLDIRFGIYTADFLKKIGREELKDRVGRIGVFLVPMKKRAAGNEKMPKDNDSDSLYDIGGLQP